MIIVPADDGSSVAIGILRTYLDRWDRQVFVAIAGETPHEYWGAPARSMWLELPLDVTDNYWFRHIDPREAKVTVKCARALLELACSDSD